MRLAALVVASLLSAGAAFAQAPAPGRRQFERICAR